MLGKYTVIRLKVHGLFNPSWLWWSVSFSEFQTKSWWRTKVGITPTSGRFILKCPSLSPHSSSKLKKYSGYIDEGDSISSQNEAISGSEVGVMPTFVFQQIFLFETLRRAHVTLMDDFTMITPYLVLPPETIKSATRGQTLGYRIQIILA